MSRENSMGPSTPGDWAQALRRYWVGAPETLVQPILPGWTFNINSNNSRSPQTELDVLAKHSYGRQLGRISDALAFLIEQRPKGAPFPKALQEFVDMKKEIDKVKE